MGDKTGIEWTDATWNPIRGCSRVSEGCRNCYAETVANRFKGEGMPYQGLIAKGGQWNGTIKVVDHAMEQPLRWQKPRRIFVNSMSDLFHENVSFKTIAAIFGVMALAQHHTFQVLTKRPERMNEFFTWLGAMRGQDTNGTHYTTPTDPLTGCLIRADQLLPNSQRKRKLQFEFNNSKARNWPLPNVWLGVSVEDQATADERIPLLLQTPAAVRWVSAEPLLGPVKFNFIGCPQCGVSKQEWWPNYTICKSCGAEVKSPPDNTIDWVVVGGESGKGARPMKADWARSLRDQCASAGIPFLFKQWGEYAPNWLNDDNGQKIPDSEWMDQLGKKSAGRKLDGRIWDEYPQEGALYPKANNYLEMK